MSLKAADGQIDAALLVYPSVCEGRHLQSLYSPATFHAARDENCGDSTSDSEDRLNRHHGCSGSTMARERLSAW